jgi:hypothetical protein
MENPDRAKCICQGRGKYFVRPVSGYPMRCICGEPHILQIPAETESEVFCGFHGYDGMDIEVARSMGIYVAGSF